MRIRRKTGRRGVLIKKSTEGDEEPVPRIVNL
jgi:hypothetical protein